MPTRPAHRRSAVDVPGWGTAPELPRLPGCGVTGLQRRSARGRQNFAWPGSQCPDEAGERRRTWHTRPTSEQLPASFQPTLPARHRASYRPGPGRPVPGPGRGGCRRAPTSNDTPGRPACVPRPAAAAGWSVARWFAVSRSCSLARRAAAAWAARCWFSRSRVTASVSDASWASNASSCGFSLRPTKRAADSRTDAVRSPCPALLRAGTRPHSSRAARSYSPAATVSGPPRRPSTTRAAELRKSDAAHAASAATFGSPPAPAWTCSVARAAAAVACSQIRARSSAVNRCRSPPASSAAP